jgi:quaternary ammonium compound-resistance protein SugE
MPAAANHFAMAWVYLIVGGLFEVGFTTTLRFVDGFRNIPWTIAFLVSVAISMALLEIASRSIPMGTAYAVWGGIGAVGTVIVGLAFFGEPASTIRVLLILAIVAAIAELRLAS